MSEPGGFAEPERRLATSEESYCAAEVLRWSHDSAGGTLRIVDSRLLLGCCGSRSMRVERLDRIYEITERDEPDPIERRCDSVCAFDFAASIPEVPLDKVFVKLLRDVTDVQTSAEVVWQGEIDLRTPAGEIVLDSAPASAVACSESLQ